VVQCGGNWEPLNIECGRAPKKNSAPCLAAKPYGDRRCLAPGGARMNKAPFSRVWLHFESFRRLLCCAHATHLALESKEGLEPPLPSPCQRAGPLSSLNLYFLSRVLLDDTNYSVEPTRAVMQQHFWLSGVAALSCIGLTSLVECFR